MHVVIFEAFIQFFQLFIALFHTERLNDKEKPKNPQHNSKEDNEEHCLPDRVNKCKNTKNDTKNFIFTNCNILQIVNFLNIYVFLFNSNF